MNFKKSLMFVGVILTCYLQSNAEGKNYKEIKDMSDYKLVMNSVKPQILKFYTTSCGACKSMEPIFNNVAGKQGVYADFSAINIEDDKFKALIQKHSLVAVPTTLFIKSGEEIKRDKGSMTEEDFENQVKNFSQKR